MNNNNLEIYNMTYVKVKEYIEKGYNRLIIPIGTMEAHSNHLPLATDVYIPWEIAKKIAPKIKALIAPPIFYGITRSLLSYPGSSAIKAETLKNLVKEIILSHKRQGFDIFIILNGHSTNSDIIKSAQYDLWVEYGIKSVRIDWWIYAKDVTQNVFGKMGAHAGIDETAMILATHPELVVKDANYESEVQVHTEGITVYPYPGALIMYKSANEGLPEFDEKKAKEYFEAVTDFLAKNLGEILEKIEKK